MSNNPYLYEKLVATRQAEILHDMQQSRMPARTKQSPTFVADKLGTLLIDLGTRLQRTKQQHSASLS